LLNKSFSLAYRTIPGIRSRDYECSKCGAVNLMHNADGRTCNHLGEEITVGLSLPRYVFEICGAFLIHSLIHSFSHSFIHAPSCHSNQLRRRSRSPGHRSCVCLLSSLSARQGN